MADKHAIAEILRKGPVIPVIVIEKVEEAVPLAKALVEGGVSVLEVTLRSEAAPAALRAIKASVPEAVLGVGTVTTPEQLREAAALGVAFAVSPGATPRLLDAAEELALPFLPGAGTASEVMALTDRGYRFMKLFPAGPLGGVATLRGYRSVFREVRFCPTGGIDESNASAYLELANVACVGGSWLAPRILIERHAWPEITRIAMAAARLAVPA